MTIRVLWRMRFACWVTKVITTHSHYVMLSHCNKCWTDEHRCFLICTLPVVLLIYHFAMRFICPTWHIFLNFFKPITLGELYTLQRSLLCSFFIVCLSVFVSVCMCVYIYIYTYIYIYIYIYFFFKKLISYFHQENRLKVLTIWSVGFYIAMFNRLITFKEIFYLSWEFY